MSTIVLSPSSLPAFSNKVSPCKSIPGHSYLIALDVSSVDVAITSICGSPYCVILPFSDMVQVIIDLFLVFVPSIPEKVKYYPNMPLYQEKSGFKFTTFMPRIQSGNGA